MSKHRRAKHRRPTRIQRMGRPVHLSIAAGVAGTVAVTGSVVSATAAPASPRMEPVANTTPLSDIETAPGLYSMQSAVQAQEERQQKQLAEQRQARAERRAEKRRAAKRRAAERRAAERAAEQAAAEQAEEARSSQTASRSTERMSASAANVLSIAAQQEGDQYVYGAAGPDQFDCSGFTQYVFGKVGISLPHSSSAQSSVATPVSSPQPGDLVFVHNGGGGSIGHVAIYAGGGYWYEASNPSQPVGKHAAWSSNVSYGRVL